MTGEIYLANISSTVPSTTLQPTYEYGYGNEQENHTAFAALYIVLCALSVFINGTILITLARFPTFHTWSYKIMASLSVSQFLLGTTIAPMAALAIFNKAEHNPDILPMRRTLTPALVVLTSNNLVFYAFERYVQIITGAANYNMYEKTVKLAIFSAYLAPGLTYLLRFLGDKDKTYLIMINIEAWVIGAIVVLLFCAVATALHNYTKDSTTPHDPTYRGNIRNAKTMLAAILFYVVMTIPFAVHMVQLGPAGEFDVRVMSACLGTTVVIPFIFICGNISLRAHMGKLFSFKGLKKQINVRTIKVAPVQQEDEITKQLETNF